MNEKTLPESLCDPKFENLRYLLLHCEKFGKTDSISREKLVRFFEGMSEQDRSAYEPLCLEWYEFLHKKCPDIYIAKPPACYPKGRSVQDAYPTLKLAIFACCCGSCGNPTRITGFTRSSTRNNRFRQSIEMKPAKKLLGLNTFT